MVTVPGVSRGASVPRFLLAIGFAWLTATPATSYGDEESEHAAPLNRIAFGSCAFQWAEQPIWDAGIGSDPDIFLFIGDAIYGDFDGAKPYTPTAESLRIEWEKLAAQPGFRRLRGKVPVLGTWDNHDYGKHNGGAEFELKEASREIFLEFFGEPVYSVRRLTPGIFDAKLFGPPGRRVQIILLDTRFFKGPPLTSGLSKEEKAALGLTGSLGNYVPNKNPEVTLLGGEQWAWLEWQLRKPAEVRFIASSTQVVADEKGMDEWGNYPLERTRLFDLIRETSASGVILLSGNVHFAEISETMDGPYPLVDFTSSGLTHVNEEYAKAKNSYRVAGPYAEVNFGLIEIDWSDHTGPSITLKTIGIDGKTAFEHTILMSSLESMP